MTCLSVLRANALVLFILTVITATIVPAAASAQTQNAATPACNATTASSSSSASTPAANGQNQTIQQSAQNVENAAKQVGSIFKKKASSPSNANANAAPCPPAANVNGNPAPTTNAPASNSGPNSAAAPAAQPANSAAVNAAPAPLPAGQPQPDPALAKWATADPFVPDAATGGAAPSYTAALTGATAAPNAPPDFAKLPDIGGFLRVGLTIDQSKDAIIKMHPSVKMSYGLAPNNQIGPVSRDGNPPLGGLKMHLSDEDIFFYYTQPPNGPQAAFAVVRAVNYPAPGIDYQKLVDALRQKYGPETMAGFYSASGNGPADMLYWLYDEQGHFIPPDKTKGAAQGPQGAPFNCGGATVFWPPTGPSLGTWSGWMDQYRLNKLPPPKFCDAVVELLVHIVGGRAPVTNTVTTIYDQALLRRDATDAGAAAKAKVEQQQQQQLDQSKQAKPSL